MTDPAPTFEIRPGEGIGPFRLGMTRAEVRDLARREFGIEARPRDNAHPEHADRLPGLGIEVWYDDDGRCRLVEAEFGYAFESKAAVRLFGNGLMWMPADEVIELCKQRWADVEDWHYWCEVPSAGLRLTYYDTPSDGAFSLACVFPPARGQ